MSLPLALAPTLPSTVPSTLASTGLAPAGLGHVVHYGIVFAGLAGLALLLVPAYAERWRWSVAMPDQHDLRVRELRRRIAAGALSEPAAASPPAPAALHRPLARSVALPVAMVGSLAAAGVHAAVAPRHLTAGLMVAGFFLATAAAQVVWAALVRSAPTAPLLRAGAVGNAALLVVWSASRTIGLPGLGVEAVGPWDLAAGAWEVAVVAACLSLLHTPEPASRRSWHPVATGWLAASVVLLGILSVSGAPA